MASLFHDLLVMFTSHLVRVIAAFAFLDGRGS